MSKKNQIYEGKETFLMNNVWECENLKHRQDISLTGEFCDDTYFSMQERIKKIKEQHSTEPGKVKALIEEPQRRYIGQIMHVASCIKVVQDAMLSTGKSKEQVDSVLEEFVESFVNNLDLQKIQESYGIEDLMNEFGPNQKWIEKID